MSPKNWSSLISDVLERHPEHSVNDVKINTVSAKQKLLDITYRLCKISQLNLQISWKFTSHEVEVFSFYESRVKSEERCRVLLSME